jgi:hypothetical protein
MTETEKMEPPTLEDALGREHGRLVELQDLLSKRSEASYFTQMLVADRQVILQALTAWNTRPDADCAPPVEPCRECAAVSAAIGGVKFMDPPDGGDVSLSEQVRRMRQTRYTRPAPALDREGVVACIRDAADRGFEAGKAGAIHFRFPDIIARVDALLSASTVEG